MLASNENSFSPEQFSTDKVQNSNPKDRNIFLVKHDSYGSREWIKDLGISDEESGVSMSFDASDNVYLTGYKINSLEGNKDLRDFSVFLIKYNSLGRRVWIKKMGNSTVKDGARLIVDSSENIYVTGFYDEFESRNTLLVKYNTSGNRAWTKILGSKLTDFAWDVTVDSNNNICVARLSGDSFLQNINRQDDVLLTKFNTDGVKL
tara:strand:- start:177 stop:791 length:615 start_codon:yes stop_codon:yes gene_type:complete